MMVIRRRRKAGSLKLVRKSKSFNQETLTRSFKEKKDNCLKFRDFRIDLFVISDVIVIATGSFNGKQLTFTFTTIGRVAKMMKASTKDLTLDKLSRQRLDGLSQQRILTLDGLSGQIILTLDVLSRQSI